MAGFWHRTAVYWGLSEPREEMSDAPAEEFSASPVDAHIAAQVAAVQSGPAAYSAPVTREFALNVPAVLRGRNIICAIATLPLQHYLAAENKVVRSPLLEQIDPDVTNLVTLAQTVEDLIFDALSWWQVLAFDAQGFPVSARHLEPGRVSLDPPHARAAQSLPSGVDVRSVVWVDGKAVPKSSMIRFDSPNPPLLVAGRRAIRRAALLDTTAAMFAEHPRPLEYYTPQDDADPDLDEVRQTLLDIKMARQTGAIAYIGAGLERHEAGSTSPADLQLVQLQARASLDIANALGLDPEDLGVSTTSRSYANITDRRRDRINDTLAPYMLAITSRLSMNDVTRRGYAARFDLSDYLKADPATRASVQAIYLDKGVVDPAEVRADEGLPPREIEPPAALEPPAAPAEPPAAAAASRRDVIPMHRDRDLPIAATFSAALAPEADPTAAPGRVTFNVPAARAGFKVDLEKRTIVGLAVPYGEVTSDWRAIQFRAGSIARMGSPEPVLLSHDGMPVGVVSSTTDADGGMSASLRISKTSTGDDALVLADDGAITGLSVGVDVHKYELDTDTDVMTVTEATLREISLTPFPAFDSARITKVQMTQQQEGSPAMKCTICGHEHAAGTPCTVTASVTTPQAPAPAPAEPSTTQVFTAPPVNVTVQMPETFAADLASAVTDAIGEGRAFVDPDRRPAGAAFVSEPLPYRLDGLKGEHEFSSDLFASIRHNDGAAKQRIQAFMKEVFVSKANVATINPSINRPDLWVDERAYSTPLWDAVNKGSIADSTPFILPNFASATNVVADHVEGTEPTLGTYVTGSQTITPAPMSGKFALVREIVDQGGNPQLSTILWAKIRRAWAEALEAKVNTLLNSLAATTVTVTTAAADAALAKEVRTKLSALQFVRGGFRFNTLPLHVDLYSALIAAQDTTGRPLFPFVDGMQQVDNAAGSVAEAWGSIRVAGLTGIPSWALGATGSVAAKSYLFDFGDVHGWATQPTDLNLADQDVANVYIGVWGYQATACTDITGVRVISYDPV